MKKLAFALIACCAFGVNAQNKVATLENVQGTVSVGGKGFVAKAVNGTALVNGSTILVPSTGKATVVMENGCSIPLLGSQHFTVNSTLTCDQAHASVRHLLASTQQAQALITIPVNNSVGGSGAAGFPNFKTMPGSEILAITTSSLLLANDIRKDDKVSGD